jgi:hypothetical protein
MALIPRNKLAQARVVIRQAIKPAPLTQLSTPHGPGHGQAAEEQHDGVDRSERLVQVQVSLGKHLGVPSPVDRIGHKQPAEEQDFRDQEQPHPQLARIELLPRRFEVVSEERGMLVIAVVSHAAAPRTVGSLVHESTVFFGT